MSEKNIFAIDEIQAALKDLEVKTSTYASVILTSDGLTVTTVAHNYVNEFEASALAASILLLGEETIKSFNHRRLQRVMIEGDLGTTILTGIDENYIMVTLTPNRTKLGLLFTEIDRTIEKIVKIISNVSAD